MSRIDSSAAKNQAATCPRFSFIIVSHNTLPLTRAAVLSINRHAERSPHEVILVDNNSADNSAANLQREFPRLKIIVFEENRGFAAANNAGAKIAAGEWLILMNSDAELLAGSMPSMEDLLRRHPELDVLGGQLLNADGSLQTSVILDHRNFRFEERHQDEELVKVPGIIGAFMVIRRELWRKLNGMDEGFFFYGEDTDFCKCAIASGAVLGWSPRFQILHHRGSSKKASNLRAIVEYWISLRYSWRKEMSPAQYRFKVAFEICRIVARVVWYFLWALFTAFLLPAFTGRLRNYFHLFVWHWHGCPENWGLRSGKSPTTCYTEVECTSHS